MGNDVADINHDGYPDVITLDMLPEDEAVMKRSVDDENISIMRLRTGKYGYNYQFPRNMLQINTGNGHFAETALMSNVAATDWSWSALFSDLDQDGHQDLFISNGIPRRPNDLDYIKYVSSQEIVNTIGTTKLVDQKALDLMPSGMVRNCVFKGTGGYQFEDKSENWLPDEKNCSSATALGDLDNDGDLDIVVNNVDDKPGIYINQSDTSTHYLKIKLKYAGQNTFGIGTRVYTYHKGVMQMKEMYTARGFQSSSEPIIHFGFGSNKQIDSVKVLWPNGSIDKLLQVKTDQTLVISPSGKNVAKRESLVENRDLLFEWVDQQSIGLTFENKEDNYTDFDRLKLLPYQQSDRGPATAVGDLNNDGLADIFFGGSKHIPAQLYVQTKTGFIPSVIPDVEKDSVKEDVDAVIEDFNQDRKSDLFIGTGGADFYNESKPLLDSYYMSADSGFVLSEIPNYYENASCVKVFDFDRDGDKDLFVGNESVSNDFGKMPRSYLLENDKGTLKPRQQTLFDNIGMVTDAVWDDYNLDGQQDLIIVGEWMQPVFLKNTNGSFESENVLKQEMAGLWQSIVPFDIDHDGDTDYLLGNWGLNSRFRASEEFPMKMYYNDFDKNGNSETIVTIYKKDGYYPLEGLDILATQLPELRKKFTTYESFAGKTIDEIFTDEQIEGSVVYEVQTLASGYLENKQSSFDFVRFPDALQISPIMAMKKYDFDGDQKEEVLVGGNYFGVQPFHGRYASFPGAFIKSKEKILSGDAIGLNLINKSVRHFNVISFQRNDYLVVTINNDKAQVYKLIRRN
jgi:enediyne biosynthesis protein E4